MCNSVGVSADNNTRLLGDRRCQCLCGRGQVVGVEKDGKFHCHAAGRLLGRLSDRVIYGVLRVESAAPRRRNTDNRDLPVCLFESSRVERLLANKETRLHHTPIAWLDRIVPIYQSIASHRGLT